MPNVDIPQGIDTGGHPRRQETMIRDYTPGSDEGRITLAELMETCTTLSNSVTQLETELSTTKAVYNKSFITLTNRVKKLESQLKQKRSSAVIHSSDEKGPNMDKDKNINLVSEQREVQETAEHSRDDDDETPAETLLNIKRSSATDKGKGIMIWDQVYTFVPKDSEREKEVMKRARFDLQQRSLKKQRLDQQTEDEAYRC
nr:hypothetical protein [Tanacetum cinerariifolium]